MSKYFMHENCQDACIEVLSVTYQNAEYLLSRVRWWNLGYSGNPWCLDPNPQIIKVLKKDISKWHNITSSILTKRTKPGLP